MTRAILLQGQQVPYILKRSTRKTIGLRVASGQLEVSVPRALTLKFVEQILQERQDWILQKVQETRSVLWELKDGLQGHIAGSPVTFLIQDVPKISLLDQQILIPQDTPREALKAFLIQKGPELVASRVQHWAEKIQVQPVKVRITRAQRRWGSMNARGILALSVGTLLLEPDLLDYVLVHELCHLHHLNHSAEYWTCVERFLPDFEDRHQRVKHQGGVLTGLF
ncbi:M48 family metallopeptidase [Deinococcus roseus]|uniref:YgjP-like metallopeptidase domain-containing protein n=1 Tax=Deinococcus roseus TaxID=392414 RepID=A0ABQ2CXV0_9DEIO|nr:SprT family zinc-dependent metalloprotease [Deinococcus roseus]GGJ30292.1 hypothetical protein GCM10008938_15380 [Deinococcus roseus]